MYHHLDISFTSNKGEKEEPYPQYPGQPYDCAIEIPEDEILDGYPSITESTCTYCESACKE